MNVVRIQQRASILDASQYGVNKNLQNEEVDAAYSRGSRGWDDEE